MKNKPLILWEHCKNPFTFKKQFHNMQLISIGEMTDEHFESKNESELEYKDTDLDRGPVSPVIYTPLGVLPLTEQTDMFQIMNFWTGHTNFNISENIFNIITDCPGVEVSHVTTRYRFRVAIGKAFHPGTVLNIIDKNVKNYILKSDID